MIRTVVDGRTTDTSTTAEGVVVTETYGPDGGWTEAAPDGGHTSASRADGVLTEEVTAPDGTVTTTRATLFRPYSGLTVLGGQEQFTTTTTAPDGTVGFVRVVGTADGGAVAAGTEGDPGGTITTATTRVDVDDTPNPDGSVTRTFTFPDGRTEAFTLNAAGEILAHEVHATGGQYDAPAGTRGVVLEVDRRSEVPGLVEQTLADGTVRQVHRAPTLSGHLVDRWTEPDGTTVELDPTPPNSTTTTVAPDGTRTVVVHDSSAAAQTTTGADGTTTRAEMVGFSAGSQVLTMTTTAPGGATVQTAVVLDLMDDGATATVTTGTVVEHVRVDVAAVPNPDGSTTHVLTFPDGRTETITTGVDGGPVALQSRPGTGAPAAVPADPVTATTTTTAPDGTVTRDTWDGTRLTSTVTGPDGSSSTATWPPPGPADARLFETVATAPDGARTVTTVQAVNVAREALATIRTGDTTTTVRVATDEIENVDGSITRVYTFPDGRTEAFTVDALGVAVHHETHPGDGSVVGTLAAQHDDGGYRGGVVSERVIATDPATGVQTVAVLRADGTTDEVHRHVNRWNGAVSDSWTEADGTRVLTDASDAEGYQDTRVEVGPDGSSTVVRVDAESGYAEDRTAPDGTVTRFRTPRDGTLPAPGTEIFSTTAIGIAGQTLTTSVVATADGGAAAVATRSDGLSVTTRLDVRGVANPDGSLTRVYTFPDGRTEAVTVDAVTGRVTAHEGVPAGGEVPPTATTETTPPPSTVTTGPDGERIETLTHADGSVETVTTNPEGTWHSEVTDTAGRTLRTEVGGGGQVVKEVTLPDGSSTAVTRWPGGLVVSATATDGTVATSTTMSTPDGVRTEASLRDPVTDRLVRTLHEADGTQTRQVYEASGDWSAVSRHLDGTVHTEAWHEGTHTVADRGPDGVATMTATDGYATTTVTEQVDGTIVQRADDGAGTVTTLTTRPDHTWTSLTQRPDGGTFEQSLTSDGRLLSHDRAAGGQPSASVELHRDGTRIEVATDADGLEARRETRPDGSWWARAEDRSGITTEAWQDHSGAQGSKVTQVTGSYQQVVQYPDGSRSVTQYTDPGTLGFGLGQVPREPTVAETVFGIPAPPPAVRVALVTRFEAADGDTVTDVTYQDGSRIQALTLADAGTMSVTKFDPAGLVTATRDGLPIPPGARPTIPTTALPALEPQGVRVAGTFEAAVTLEGKVSAAFDTGVFRGEVTAEGRVGGSVSGQGSAGVGPGGVDAQGSLEVFLGAQGRLGGTLGTPLGDLSAGMDASATAYAAAVGSAHLGLDGIQAGVSLQAMVSATVGATADADLGVAAAHLGAHAGVGLGLDLEADAEISADRVGFDFGFAAGIGLSSGADVDLSFSPSGIVDEIGDDPGSALGALIEAGSGRSYDSAGDFLLTGALTTTGVPGVFAVVAADAIGGVLKDFGDAVEDVPVIGDVVEVIEDVGDVVDDAFHAVGSLLPWNW